MTINVDMVGNQHPEDKAIPHRVLPAYSDLCNMMFDLKYGLYGEHAWYKQNIIGRSKVVRGSDLSPSCPNIGRSHEYLLTFFKESKFLKGDESLNDVTKKDWNDAFPSMWYVPPEPRKDQSDEDYHPCPFPCEIVYRLTKFFTRPGDLCLDAWNGSGTSTLVWKALGRHYIGIDNSAKYCRTAEKRIQTLDKALEGLTGEKRRKALNKIIQEFRFRDSVFRQPRNI